MGGGKKRMSVNGLFRAVRTLALALTLTLAFAANPAQAQTPAQEKTITLQVTNAPVSTVMKQIENQSGYTFFYNTKDIPLSRNVTLSIANENIRTTLDKLFQGTNVTYSSAGPDPQDARTRRPHPRQEGPARHRCHDYDFRNDAGYHLGHRRRILVSLHRRSGQVDARHLVHRLPLAEHSGQQPHHARHHARGGRPAD